MCQAVPSSLLLSPPNNSPRVGLCYCLRFTDEKTEAGTVRTSPKGAGSGPNSLLFVRFSTWPSCSSVCTRPGQPTKGQARAGLLPGCLKFPLVKPLSLASGDTEGTRDGHPFPPTCFRALSSVADGGGEAMASIDPTNLCIKSFLGALLALLAFPAIQCLKTASRGD